MMPRERIENYGVSTGPQKSVLFIFLSATVKKKKLPTIEKNKINVLFFTNRGNFYVEPNVRKKLQIWILR